MTSVPRSAAGDAREQLDAVQGGDALDDAERVRRRPCTVGHRIRIA
jgi:hypothetical protein